MSIEMESIWDAVKDVHYERTIARMKQRLSGVRQLQEALEVALDMVVNVAHAQTGTFWFYDQYGTGRISPKAVYGGGDLMGISLLPGEGIAGEVIQAGKAMIIADCQQDPRWAGRVDQKTGFRTESMICVPLELAEKEFVFGCIQIINKTDGLQFDEKDLALAENLAAETAERFKEQGLLDEYLSREGVEPGPVDDLSFTDVFCAGEEWEMEEKLRSLDVFMDLRMADREAVLKLARQMRQYFVDRTETKTKKFGFWK